jgi:hypothetical protein
MWFTDFIMRLFERNIPQRRYFDEKSMVLNLPEISSNISILKLKAKVGAKIGSYSANSSVKIPEHITSELISLDISQFQLAPIINALHGKRRQDKINEYADIILKIYEFQNKATQTALSQQVDTDDVKKNPNKDSYRKFLDDRKFKTILLPDDLDNNQGYIIWPVTLLPQTTYIHRAQVQVILPLINYGWKLLVIIGDCGKDIKLKEAFYDDIQRLLMSFDINVSEQTIAYLSDYYNQNDHMQNSKIIEGVSGTQILNFFHRISERIIWQNFDKLIKKNYDNLKMQDIEKRTVLNNIQPLLFWSLISTIVTVCKSKAILIAGEDEQEQWEYIISQFTNHYLGVIYIRELTDGDGKTMSQEDFKIRNSNEMKEKLEIGNMAEWLFTHFVELPKFMSNQKPSFCRISEVECANNNSNCLRCLFEQNNYSNEYFDKQGMVEYIWPMSNPAN